MMDSEYVVYKMFDLTVMITVILHLMYRSLRHKFQYRYWDYCHNVIRHYSK